MVLQSFARASWWWGSCTMDMVGTAEVDGAKKDPRMEECSLRRSRECQAHSLLREGLLLFRV